MFKNLHPIFQFVIIALLLVLYVFTAVKLSVGFAAGVLLLVLAAAIGASITTHEENQLDYKIKALAAKARKDV